MDAAECPHASSEDNRAESSETALASFNVQEYGTEGVVRLTAEEIHARVGQSHSFGQSERKPNELTVA